MRSNELLIMMRASKSLAWFCQESAPEDGSVCTSGTEAVARGLTREMLDWLKPSKLRLAMSLCLGQPLVAFNESSCKPKEDSQACEPPSPQSF